MQGTTMTLAVTKGHFLIDGDEENFWLMHSEESRMLRDLELARRYPCLLISKVHSWSRDISLPKPMAPNTLLWHQHQSKML